MSDNLQLHLYTNIWLLHRCDFLPKYTQIQLQIILFLLFWDVLWIINDLLAPLSLFFPEFQQNSQFLRTISNKAPGPDNISPRIGRSNVVADNVIIFCQSKKKRVFTFFIPLEKHLKLIISWKKIYQIKFEN